MRLALLITLAVIAETTITVSTQGASPAPPLATTQNITGWVITYEVVMETPQMKMRPLRQIITVQGNLVRMDVGPQMSLVINNESGEQLMVFHFMKAFQRVSASQTKEVNEQALKQMKRSAAEHAGRDTAASPPTIKPSGRTEVICGYKTSEYIVPGPLGGTAHHWVTTELPDVAALRAAMESAFSKSPVFQHQKRTFNEVPGFPIRTELESPQGKNTSTMLSIEKKAIPSDQFEPPAGYKETPQVAQP